MSSSSAAQVRQETVATEGTVASRSAATKKSREGTYLLFISFLCLGAWYVGTLELYKSGSDLGYNLGLIGGIMMLVLLLYPVRKHVRFMRSWLPLKHWFRLHMFLGVAGPILVLFHSNFRYSSITGGIALMSMIAVFSSGLVGRIIYTRIHRGLYGRKLEFEELKSSMAEQEIESKFHFAPGIEERLHRFEERVLENGAEVSGRIWMLPFLGVRLNWTRIVVTRKLKRLLKKSAKENRWNRGETKNRMLHGEESVRQFLDSVRSVATYHAYEHLFSLWHILHVPLLFLLILAGAIHVLAVHMY